MGRQGSSVTASGSRTAASTRNGDAVVAASKPRHTGKPQPELTVTSDDGQGSSVTASGTAASLTPSRRRGDAVVAASKPRYKPQPEKTVIFDDGKGSSLTASGTAASLTRRRGDMVVAASPEQTVKFDDGSVSSDDEAWDSKLAEVSTTVEVERFRLLIIGKSGCGKTTILSKVCGEDVADKPSTTRGIHDIEKELEFKDNKHLVVHDSEGFEAGRPDEFDVVKNFIDSRGPRRKLSDQLHAIWYCLTTSARPIQQAEEMFFSVKHDVPIVAVFTKFDILVQDELQRLIESREGEDSDEDIDEEELEKQAEKVAEETFKKHFQAVLLKKPFPPQAVVTLSNVHESDEKKNSLDSLIKATSKSLVIANRVEGQKANLGALFATAQMASLSEKQWYSIHYGMPGVITARTAKGLSTKSRRNLIGVWNTVGTNSTEILAEFKKHVQHHPQTFGNKASLTHSKFRELKDLEREACRIAQLATDLTVIMTEIFLRKIRDRADVKNMVKKYPSTPAYSFIQKELLELDWKKAHNLARGELELFGFRLDILQIIRHAIS